MTQPQQQQPTAAQPATGGPAPANQTGMIPATGFGVFLPAGAQAVDNFDGSPRDRLRLHSIAATPDAEPIKDNVGQVIECVYYSVNTYEKEDAKSGEIDTLLRIVLIDVHGVAWTTGSKFILRELAAVVSYLGNGKFDPPLKCKIVSGKSNHPSDFLTLEIVL